MRKQLTFWRAASVGRFYQEGTMIKTLSDKSSPSIENEKEKVYVGGKANKN